LSVRPLAAATSVKYWLIVSEYPFAKPVVGPQ
jgi:hypothetical protein